MLVNLFIVLFISLAFMVIISEKSVEKIVSDVAPKVERLTGWSCHLESLILKLVNRNQVFEHAIEPTYMALGIDTKPRSLRERLSLQLLKYAVSIFPLGIYEPATGTIIIVPDNFSPKTNESGLATAIGHELVHRCQSLNNPEFAENFFKTMKKMIGPGLFSDDEPDARFVEYMRAYMTLEEGDASFVQEQLEKIYYQNAYASTHASNRFFGGIASLFVGELKQKLRQYTVGKSFVQRIAKKSGRTGVNALYSLHPQKLRKKIYTPDSSPLK